jgi:hypothetical protein
MTRKVATAGQKSSGVAVKKQEMKSLLLIGDERIASAAGGSIVFAPSLSFKAGSRRVIDPVKKKGSKTISQKLKSKAKRNILELQSKNGVKMQMKRSHGKKANSAVTEEKISGIFDAEEMQDLDGESSIGFGSMMMMFGKPEKKSVEKEPQPVNPFFQSICEASRSLKQQKRISSSEEGPFLFGGDERNAGEVSFLSKSSLALFGENSDLDHRIARMRAEMITEEEDGESSMMFSM